MDGHAACVQMKKALETYVEVEVTILTKSVCL